MRPVDRLAPRGPTLAASVAIIALTIAPFAAGNAAIAAGSDDDSEGMVDRRVALATVPAVVWQAEAGLQGGRIHASVPPEAPAVRLGPSGPGVDGPWIAVAGRGESIWVSGSRQRGDGSDLWVQRWTRGRWMPPGDAPRARTWNYGQSLGVADDSVWLVWMSEDDDGVTALFTARGREGGWTSPEPLPATPGRPTGPDVAVLDDGTPVAVWVGGGGTDAQIWISRRGPGGWSPPVALRAEADVRAGPAIAPRIATDGRRLLVTWSSFTGAGYVPVARRIGADGSGDPPRRLGETGSGRPVALATGDSFAVVWPEYRGPEDGWLIRSASERDGDWSPPVTLTRAAGPRFDAATSHEGRAALSWRDRDRGPALVEGGFGPVIRRGDDPALRKGADDAENGVGSAGAASGDLEGSTTKVDGLPRWYLAFGDSVTDGVVVDESGDPIFTEGYPGRLDERLDSLLGPVSVPNAGVSGERTDEGLARIDGAIAANDPDAILILEGFNDVSASVDTDTVVFNLRQMVQAGLAAGLDTFIGLLIPRFHDGGFEGSANVRTDEVNDGIRTIAAETAARLADLHTPFDGHPELYSDRIHPNEEGYRVMGDTWFEEMRPHLLIATNRGDLDGSGRVDGVDLVELALAFGSSEGDPRYRKAADVNLDGIVDGLDLSILAEFFSRSTDGS